MNTASSLCIRSVIVAAVACTLLGCGDATAPAPDAGSPDAGDAGGADTSSLIWSARLPGYPGGLTVANHVTLAFDDRFWVMGGIRGGSSSSERNDVWSTSDGASWTMVTEHAAWSPRSMFAGAVFHGAMWIVDGPRTGDVWRSVDGATWIRVEGNRFPPRYGHRVVVFKERLFIIAGYGATGRPIGDVWSSADGQDWRQETELAEFGTRDASTVFVFGDRIWLAGGSHGEGPLADVWSSLDGAQWTEVIGTPGFPRRRGAGGVVFNGRMWLFGGDGVPSNNPLLDAWSSRDGATWTLAPQGPWTNPGYDLTATTFADAVWVISGGGVWRMSQP